MKFLLREPKSEREYSLQYIWKIKTSYFMLKSNLKVTDVTKPAHC